MQGFRATLCSYSSGEGKLLQILENEGGFWNKAVGKVFVGKGNNINVGKAGTSHVGNGHNVGMGTFPTQPQTCIPASITLSKTHAECPGC